MKVELAGYTVFQKPDVPWEPEDSNEVLQTALVPLSLSGQDLVEFAGRACYQSWNRPNPATASNAGYVAHLLDVGHWSVLEHASASFYITGISRSLTHELVRHRHFSYSQLSQRYVGPPMNYVVPPEFEGDEEFEQELAGAFLDQVGAYDRLYAIARKRLTAQEVTGTEARKRARQAARAVLGNLTETKIVVTGNYRAWMHFVNLRAAAPADVEIRRLAVELLRQLQDLAPSVFDHFKIIRLEDGSEAAEGPVVT